MAGRKHQRKCGSGPHLCELCNITTTSEDHMTLHLRGKSHQRKQKIHDIQMRQVRGGSRALGL